LFRYSGSKTRYLEHYRKPLENIKRVVEPYLGSGAYLLNTKLPGLGVESNGDIVAMWKWLQTTTPAELRELYDEVENIKKNPATPDKPDVRLMLGLNPGQQTYVRINTTGVLVGQLTAWKIYPQNRLPVEQTILCLPRLKDIEVVQGDASSYVHQDGDLLFVDPPYLGTTAGYEEKGKKNHEKTYKASDTTSLLASTSNPAIFTYGDGAEVHFPQFTWEKVMTRKVPNVRRGGTVDRTEWVTYANW
jgi:site-specific DNA-adenine methylase